jgi:branched-chain amino acid transport system substrate-binding protein
MPILHVSTDMTDVPARLAWIGARVGLGCPIIHRRYLFSMTMRHAKSAALRPDTSARVSNVLVGHGGLRPQRCTSLAFLIAATLVLQGCNSGNQVLTTATPGAAAAKAPAGAKSVSEPEGLSVSLASPPVAPSEPGAAPRAPVKVGLILPLTGPGQAGLIADSMKMAAELALRDLQAKHVQLIIRDDKGTPEGALAAATEVTNDGVELVLGPLYARSVATVSAIARAKNAPVIAFSNDRQVASSSTHLLSFLAGPEVARVVAFASQQGKKRYVALIPDDAYGKLVEPSFKEAVARQGGSVVASQTYPADTGGRVAGVLTVVKALRDEIRGLEEHGDKIDAIFIPGGEDTVQLIGPLLKQAELDTKRIKIIGTGALDSPNAGRDEAFVGAWFAAPDPRGFKDFSERFVKAYGRAPPRIATLAYDAASLAAALATGPDGARFIPSALTRSSGFNGVDGLFRLMSDGVTDRALAVLEVQKFGATVIDQPAATIDGGSSILPSPSSLLGPGPVAPQGSVTKIN